MPFNEAERKEKIEVLHKKEGEDLARILAQKYKLPYLNLLRAGIDLDALHIIPEEVSREAGVAIIKAAGKKLQLAIKNPTTDKTKEAIDELRRNGYEPQLFLVSMASLEHAWSRYKEISAESAVTSNVINISKGDLAEFRSKIKNTRDFSRFLTQKITAGATRRVTDLLDLILAGAFELVVSDVHVEPAEKEIRMRVRLDGILQDITTFPHEVHKMLISRVKLVCELKLNVHDRSQDGRFTIRADNVDVEVRVSILPSPYGESIVMRILHPRSISATYEDLGMEAPLSSLIEKELQKPNGMIITTGPTGSGKTTTLYAFIKKLNEPGIKIITIEDPIEYHMQGVTQTQTHKDGGYTFETGLAAIVRQDPDIILVGEMRNRETAEIGMQASLTGHLVFSTLHTNNAPGTIPRLIDLGVPPNIIAPAINVAIAQRLVRLLCANCKRKTAFPKDQLDVITRLVSTLPQAYEYARELLKKMDVYETGACEQCSDTGFKGRIGLFEAFLIDDSMEELILKNPSEAAVREAAVKQGMVTLQQDGAIKILAGKTSFDEVNRMVGLV